MATKRGPTVTDEHDIERSREGRFQAEVAGVNHPSTDDAKRRPKPEAAPGEGDVAGRKRASSRDSESPDGTGGRGAGRTTKGAIHRASKLRARSSTRSSKR